MPKPSKVLEIGTKFGRLEVIGPATKIELKGGKRTAYPVRCQCGKELVIPLHKLPEKRSCGCAWREKTETKSKAIPVGERFGRLEITGPYVMIEEGKGRLRAAYPVKCVCGHTLLMTAHRLLNGNAKACGKCIREYHGGSETKLFSVWHNMNRRCHSPNERAYKNYGGRGIKVCDEWRASFGAFQQWAFDNGYEEGLTIERVNVDGGYNPENCTWIPPEQQAWNKTTTVRATIFGEERRVADWVDDPRCSVDYYTLYQRLKLGWVPEIALTHPYCNAYNGD